MADASDPVITIEPIRCPFTATVTPPGSKSLTNRALVLAALAEGISTISNILVAEDTVLMLDALAKLGFDVNVDRERRRARITGAGGMIPAESAEIFCGNSGTTLRFLTALCTLGRGEYLLDGVERMRRRPIGELVDLLKNLGGRVRYAGEPGFPPVLVRGRAGGGGLAGGLARFGAAQSSQFLSAALHVAPISRHEVQLELDQPQTSWPYVAMTMRLMDEFGAWCELTRDPKTGQPTQINVARGKYTATDYAVEPDASSAGYFLAAAAINEGSKVTIDGLSKSSLQGDVRFAEILRRMGAIVKYGDQSISVEGSGGVQPVDVDLADMPDVAQTLAVVSLFADGESRLRGLKTLRVKETDRLSALEKELSKIGAKASAQGDEILITPPKNPLPATIDTYDDHRMAMSFAVAATRVHGLSIRNPGCVNKTYPGFFEDFSRVVTSDQQA
jgi:3-phosphoshikimate 1-carboxyvinyltransferase